MEVRASRVGLQKVKIKKEPVSPQKQKISRLATTRDDDNGIAISSNNVISSAPEEDVLGQTDVNHVNKRVYEWMQKCVDAPSTEEDEEEHYYDTETDRLLAAGETSQNRNLPRSSAEEHEGKKLEAVPTPRDDEEDEESSEVSSDSGGVDINYVTKPPCAGCKYCGGIEDKSESEEDKDINSKTGDGDGIETAAAATDNTKEGDPRGSPKKPLERKDSHSSSSIRNDQKSNDVIIESDSKSQKDKLSDDEDDDYVDLAPAAAEPTKKDVATGMGSSQEEESGVEISDSEDDIKKDPDSESDQSQSEPETKKYYPQRKHHEKITKNKKSVKKKKVEVKPPRRITRSMVPKKSLSSDSEDEEEETSESSESDQEGTSEFIDDDSSKDSNSSDEESKDNGSETSSVENKPRNIKGRHMQTRKLRSKTNHKIHSSSSEEGVRKLRSRKVKAQKKKPLKRNHESEDEDSSESDGETKNTSKGHEDTDNSEISISEKTPSPRRIRTRGNKNCQTSRRKLETVKKRRVSEEAVSSEDEECRPGPSSGSRAPIFRNSNTKSLTRRSFSRYKGESHPESSCSSPAKSSLKSTPNLNKSTTRSGRVLRPSTTKHVSFDKAVVSPKKRRKRIRVSSSSSSESSDIFIAVKVPHSELNGVREPVNAKSSDNSKSDDEDSDEPAAEQSSPETKRSPPPEKRRKVDLESSSSSASGGSHENNSSSEEDEKPCKTELQRKRSSRWPKRSPSPYRESPSPQDMSEAVVRDLKSFVDTTGVGIRRRRRQFSGNKFVQDAPEKESGSEGSSDSFVDQTGEVGGILESSDSNESSGEEEPEDNLDLNSDNFESGSSEDDVSVEEDSGPEKSQSESDEDRRKKSQPPANSVLDICALCKNLASNRQIAGRDLYPTSHKWCKCGCCKVVGPKMRDYDRTCCQEFQSIRKFLSDDDEIKCITDHEGFKDILNYIKFLKSIKTKTRRVDGLSSSWATTELSKFKNAIDEIKIHMVGDAFARWIFGRLQDKDRVPLPACAMKKIRQQYAPNSGPSYFKPFKPGMVCETGIHCNKAKIGLT